MEGETGLVFDTRDADPDGPGVHAFVMGVSRYRGRGRGVLDDIPGTAVGAARFAEFLRDDFHDPTDVPLRTIRVLLSTVDAELEHLPRFEVPAGEATRSEVERALNAWLLDCDRHVDNIGVLYFGGHGVFVGHDAQYVFLSEAYKPYDQFHHSVHVHACVDTAMWSRLRSLIVVSDFCAFKVPGPIDHGGPVMLRVGALGRDPYKAAACEFVLNINAARAGTPGYALGAGAGTLLVKNLLPVLRGEAGGTLVGDVLEEKDFRVTKRTLQTRLVAAILDCLRSMNRSVEADPSVRGEDLSSGVNRPQPPPTFRVDFSPHRPGTEIAVEVHTAKGDTLVRESETISGTTSVLLPAGCYRVVSRDGSPKSSIEPLEVNGPVEHFVGRFL